MMTSNSYLKSAMVTLPIALVSLELNCVDGQLSRSGQTLSPSPPSPSSNTSSNPMSQYSLSSDLDPTMAIVIVVLVCVFFLVGFFSIYIRQCAEQTAASSPSTRPARHRSTGYPQRGRRGLDPDVVDAFPVLAYIAVKDHKLGESPLECAVCLSEFEDFDSLKLLPKCDHAFHPQCIDAWLASHVTCPVCRANLTPQPRLTETLAPPASERSRERRVEEIRPPDELQNEVRIDIDGAAGAAEEAVPRTTDGAIKLPRSHSTGHSLSPLGGDLERYALRLPEEVRNQIIVGGPGKAGMKRSSSSDVVLVREGSSIGFVLPAAAPITTSFLSMGDGWAGGRGAVGLASSGPS